MSLIDRIRERYGLTDDSNTFPSSAKTTFRLAQPTLPVKGGFSGLGLTHA
jgi:hypothetical protein